MKRYETILNPRHKVAVVAVAVALVAVLVLLDLKFGVQVRIFYPILYTFPLLAALWVRDRRFLWTAALLLCGATFLPLAFLQFPANEPSNFHVFRAFNRGLACVEILMTALVMHVLIRVWIVAQRRQVETLEEHRRLEESHEELAAREEEISRQNEELQSQTEELERQSEELRIANDELSRRERLLESLLTLSRSLSAELSSNEAMGRICASLDQLVNGPGLASAILEKHGDELVVRCHHGFGPGGVVKDHLPYAHSFAALVIERGQTGYLEDVSVRPDLQLPEGTGGQKSRSILAAPIKVGRKTVGSLEVYSPQPRKWTDEQIALVESLAAQTSVTLETAALFEEVQQQRRRLQSVLQTVPIGISILSDDGDHLEMNPAAALMLGLPVGRTIGPSDIARFVHLRDGLPIAPEETPLYRALRDGIESHGVEIEVGLPGAGGRRVTLLVGASPVRGADGKIDGAVAAFADITAQKNLQRELDARRREAEEVSVRKTRFLAAVSHDIRTPANAIGLLGELLQRASGNAALASEIPELAKDLHRSAMSLVNLVSDVLDLTRMDTGKVDLLESEFDLGPVVAEECRQLLPLAKQKNLTFTCHPPAAGPLWIRTDRMKLARVLGNLIGNAIKFTQRGTVDVRATRHPEDGRVAITVADTGSGIGAEHIDLIFDEFFQLRNPERDSSKGSGLGLSISKRLIDAMGGTLTVQSKVGEGSTFTVTLPGSAVIGVGGPGASRMTTSAPTTVSTSMPSSSSASREGGNGAGGGMSDGSDGNGQEDGG